MGVVPYEYAHLVSRGKGVPLLLLYGHCIVGLFTFSPHGAKTPHSSGPLWALYSNSMHLSPYGARSVHFLVSSAGILFLPYEYAPLAPPD